MFPITITLKDHAQLNAVLAALNFEVEGDAQAVATATEAIKGAAEKSKANPAKAEVVRGQAESPKPDAAQSSEPTPTASDNSESSSNESNESDGKPAPTYEDAKAAVLKLGKVKGRQASLDALSRFGATKLPDVLPEHFADLIQLVDEVIAGAEV